MLAWILQDAGLEPGFLIGGIPANFGTSARAGQGGAFVIEADEYDTAFFDKRAKFVHYWPRHLLLTNLEFDHADIYPDLASIQRQFHHLVRTVPASGRIAWNAGDAALRATLAMGSWTPLTEFAREGAAEWRARLVSNDGASFEVLHRDAAVGLVRWPLIGMHNVENGLAAIACAAGMGVAASRSAEALGRFAGVRRRLELRGEVQGIRVFDDFAHHPTAVAMTIDGVRRQPEQGRIIAVLEPRSNTMRLGVHRAELAESLAGADRVWLYQPAGLDWNLDGVAAELGAKAAVMRAMPELVEALVADLQGRRPRADHEQRRIRRTARSPARGAPGAARVNAEVRELPLFPLNTVLFPGGPLPLRIFEPRYLDMVSRCMREQTGFAVVLLGEGEEVATATSFAATGTEARIVDFDRLEGNVLGISCIGRERVRIVEAWREADGLNRGRVLDIAADPVVPVPLDQAWLSEVVLQVMPEAGDTYLHVERREDAAWVANRLAELLPLSLADRQTLLELADPLERLSVLEPAVTRSRN